MKFKDDPISNFNLQNIYTGQFLLDLYFFLYVNPYPRILFDYSLPFGKIKRLPGNFLKKELLEKSPLLKRKHANYSSNSMLL